MRNQISGVDPKTLAYAILRDIDAFLPKNPELMSDRRRSSTKEEINYIRLSVRDTELTGFKSMDITLESEPETPDTSEVVPCVKISQPILYQIIGDKDSHTIRFLNLPDEKVSAILINPHLKQAIRQAFEGSGYVLNKFGTKSSNHYIYSMSNKAYNAVIAFCIPLRLLPQTQRFLFEENGLEKIVPYRYSAEEQKRANETAAIRAPGRSASTHDAKGKNKKLPVGTQRLPARAKNRSVSRAIQEPPVMPAGEETAVGATETMQPQLTISKAIEDGVEIVTMGIGNVTIKVPLSTLEPLFPKPEVVTIAPARVEAVLSEADRVAIAQYVGKIVHAAIDPEGILSFLSSDLDARIFRAADHMRDTLIKTIDNHVIEVIGKTFTDVMNNHFRHVEFTSQKMIVDAIGELGLDTDTMKRVEAVIAETARGEHEKEFQYTTTRDGDIRPHRVIQGGKSHSGNSTVAT